MQKEETKTKPHTLCKEWYDPF